MSKKLMLVAVMIGLVSVLALPIVVCATDATDGGLTMPPDFTNSGLPTTPLPETAANIINAALSLLGLVAVVIILIGGFKWMTAMGDEANVKKAKSLIIEGVIGLVIIVCSYAIAKFVIDALNNTVAPS